MNDWHTGTPTEEGWYAVAIKDFNGQEVVFPTLCVWENNSFHAAGGISDFLDFTDEVVKWYRIGEEKKKITIEELRQEVKARLSKNYRWGGKLSGLYADTAIEFLLENEDVIEQYRNECKASDLSKQINKLEEHYAELKQKTESLSCSYNEDLENRKKAIGWVTQDLEKRKNKLEKEIEELERNRDSIFKSLNPKFCSYVDNFFNALNECETPEGRDAMKRVQVYVNNAKYDSKYDNATYNRGLAIVLCNEKIGDIPEFMKFNCEKVKQDAEWGIDQDFFKHG